MEGKVEKIVYGGYGLVRDKKGIVFLENVIPEEIVEYEITDRKKSFSFGRVKSIIEKSRYRIEPKCKYFPYCGGCDFQHIKYNFQLKIKKDIIFETLQRIGKIENFAFDFKVIPSLSPYFYRNSANVKFKDNKKGFFKKKSNELIEINSCNILSVLLNKVYKNVQLSSGEIRIFATKQGDTFLWKEHVIENVLNCKFRISKDSFFQTNIFQLENLLNVIRSYTVNSDKIVDLYSGVGFFSIFLAKLNKKVIGIESAKSSFKDSQFNIKLNELSDKRLKFYNVRVERASNIIKRLKPDTVILDPPRNGVSENVIKNILSLKGVRRIIYVSCNSVTLARDLNKLSDFFYIGKLIFIDMFPQTFHIETIAILEREK